MSEPHDDFPPMGPNMQRMDGPYAHMPDGDWNVIDRAVRNSPPPMDDVGGVDVEDFDEKDPNRPGCKEGKLRVFQLLLAYFPDALLEVAKASEMGAVKYAPGNWRTVPDGIAEYEDAGARHLMRMARGEIFDDDRGFRFSIRHKAQVVWSFLASLQLELEADLKALEFYKLGLD